MAEIVIGIHAKLTKNGERDIDLLVHSDHIGSPSPCVVITDWSTRVVIGGSINSLDEVFNQEVAKHSGYAVTARANLVATVNQGPGEETKDSEAHPVESQP